MVQETDQALRHPEVIAALGTLAAELIDFNQRLVLPNVHHDTLVVPKAEKDTANPLLFPMTARQAAKLTMMTELISQQRVFSWNITNGLQAPQYGVSLDANEIVKLYDEEDECKKDIEFSAYKKRSSIVAATYSDTFQRRNTCTASRPLIVIPDIYGRNHRHASPLILAHEELHALDMVNHAPLQLVKKAQVAGEFRAYHVSGAIDQSHGESNLTERFQKIEMFRRNETDPLQPFAPTQAMVDFAIENHMLHAAH